MRGLRLRRPDGTRSRVPILLGLGVLLVLGIGVASGLAFLRAARDVRAAQAQLDVATKAFDEARYGDARAATGAARVRLNAATSILEDDPAVSAVGWLPVLKQNRDALLVSLKDALRLTTGAERIFGASSQLVGPDGKLAVKAEAGQIPLAPVRQVAQAGRELLDQLPAAGERSSGPLVLGPVKTLQDRLEVETVRRRAQLATAVPALELLIDVTGGNGSRTYLVLLANTAEMRGAGGMPLSFLIMRAENGKLQVGSARPIDDLFLQTPSPFQLPADYAERWQGYEPTRLWRNANVGPSFPSLGPQLASMFHAKTQRFVDGVVQLDPAGLAPFLALTGPVPSSVGTITAQNVVDITMNKAYVNQPDRVERQDVLSEAATAAFQKLTSTTFSSLRPLSDGLTAAIQQRHLQAWSADGQTQGTIASLHADGALPDPTGADYLHLTLQNVGATKLDYYVDTAVEVTGSRVAGKRSEALVKITVTNNAPKNGKPFYIFGADGTYKGVGSLYLPTGTTLLESEDPGVTVRAESGRTVATFSEILAAGASRSFTIRVLLPPRSRAAYALTIVPSPRIRPTRWTIDLATGGTKKRLQRDGLVMVPTVLRAP